MRKFNMKKTQDVQLTRSLGDKIIPPSQNICSNMIFSYEHDLSGMTVTVFKLEGGTAHLLFTPRTWHIVNISMEMTGWSTQSQRSRREIIAKFQVDGAWWGITITTQIILFNKITTAFFSKRWKQALF